MLPLTTLLTILLAASPATSADLYVPGTHSSIQAAIQAAGPGDTIHVAAGTWLEAIDFLGKDVRVVATSGPAVTMLIAPRQAGSTVRFVNGEGPGAVLEGFRLIENNNLDFAPLVEIVGSDPVLRRCWFEGMEGAAVAAADGAPRLRGCRIRNGRLMSGSGVVLRRSDADIGYSSFRNLDQPAISTTQASSPTVHHCTIRDCGFGLWTSSDLPAGQPDPSHLVVDRCVFARNFVDTANGAAVHVGAGLSTTITDTVFLDHPVRVLETTVNGIANDTVVFERNRVFTDSAWTFQVFCGDIDTVVLRDNFFGLDPVATQAGGGFSVTNYGTADLRANTVAGFAVATEARGPLSGLTFTGGLFAFQAPGFAFWGHGPEDSAVTSGLGAGGSAVVINDPSFVGYATRDLHLRANSVCIDASSSIGPPVDIDGDGRVAPHDFGADEHASRSAWVSGNPLPGGNLRFVAHGPPGASVFLCLAAERLPAPVPTPFGDLELGAGLLILPVGITGPDGLHEAVVTVPNAPVPGALFTQMLVDLQFTPLREFLVGG